MKKLILIIVIVLCIIAVVCYFMNLFTTNLSAAGSMRNDIICTISVIVAILVGAAKLFSGSSDNNDK